ncbi:hypothetical protein [Jannaschia sp. LMIT008]|uniref:hypothetical protein n=1 Tax=Jannaschia maritima TaxID=3032585 RepID=UPI002810BED7|nr:hypothetical protein [Jannaschia sp. LMIT008]
MSKVVPLAAAKRSGDAAPPRDERAAVAAMIGSPEWERKLEAARAARAAVLARRDAARVGPDAPSGPATAAPHPGDPAEAEGNDPMPRTRSRRTGPARAVLGAVAGFGAALVLIGALVLVLPQRQDPRAGSTEPPVPVAVTSRPTEPDGVWAGGVLSDAVRLVASGARPEDGSDGDGRGRIVPPSDMPGPSAVTTMRMAVQSPVPLPSIGAAPRPVDAAWAIGPPAPVGPFPDAGVDVARPVPSTIPSPATRPVPDLGAAVPDPILDATVPRRPASPAIGTAVRVAARVRDPSPDAAAPVGPVAPSATPRPFAPRDGAATAGAIRATERAPAPRPPFAGLRIALLVPPGLDVPPSLAGGLTAAGARSVTRDPLGLVRPPPQVRVFHDADRAAAARLAERLGVPLRDYASFRPRPAPGTIEVVLPASADR